MPKKDSYKTNVTLLPGFEAEPSLPRVTRLRAWFQRKGLSYADLARRWGCHWTWPGKCLDAETEELPEARRRDLIDNLGCPPECLPPPWDPKVKLAKNQAHYQRRKARAKEKKAASFLEKHRQWKEGLGD